MKTPVCETCRWSAHSTHRIGSHLICSRFPADRVVPMPAVPVGCSVARMTHGACGPAARYWERAPDA